MSQYLINIASRNAEVKGNDMLPPSSASNSGILGIDEDSTNENYSQVNEVQYQFIQPNEDIFQEDIIKNKPSKFDSNRPEFKETTEITENQKNFDPTYFSKYIERVGTQEKSIHLNNPSADFSRFETKKPYQKSAKNRVESRKNIDESEDVFNTFSKGIPEKNGTENRLDERFVQEFSEPHQINPKPVEKNPVSPILEEPDRKEKKNLSDKLSDGNTIAMEPKADDSRNVLRTITNEPSPKVVIGKIVIEILPPIKAPSEKIIQRVARTPSKDNFSKTNKLIFGLGQL